MTLEPQIRTKRAPTAPGLHADSSRAKHTVSALNDNPRTAQVDTITIDTATDTETYGVDLNDVDITVVAASATASDIAELLKDAINAEPLVNGRVTAERSGDDVVITSNEAGLAFTTVLDENAAKMTLANTTANDEADPVPFGRLVIFDGFSDRDDVQAVLAKASNLTAKTVVLTPTAENDAVYHVSITVDGATYAASFVADGTATAAEVVDGLVSDLNGKLPAETVIASNETNTLQLLAEIAGKSFEYAYSAHGAAGGSAALALTSDTGLATDDINKMRLGISVLDEIQEIAIGSSQAQYAANQNMSVETLAPVVVKTESALTDPTSPVYVRLAADGALDELGGFSPSSGTGLVKLAGARWGEKRSSQTATLRINQ